ncbi:MAG: hypothetical protein KF729_32340 [Sandaracinaceae bacterium]|nr:hypothetical protein [Sandaracinaceae bacterium]
MSLRTDLAAEIEIDEVVVAIDGLDPRRRPLTGADALLEGARIAELDDVPTGTRRLDVTLLRGGTPVVTRPTSVTVGPATAVTVVLTRDCRGVLCADERAQACVGARCVAPECSPETPDACPMPACVEASDCAPAAACAAVACAGGACLYGDGGGCAAAEYCAPERGCVPRPGQRPTPRFVVSLSPDRASPVALEGAHLDAPVHVFAEGVEGVTRIDYRIDGTEDWRPAEARDAPPFDLVSGSTAEVAAPLNVACLPIGAHTLRATLTRDDGTTEDVLTSFTTEGASEGWYWTDDPYRRGLRPLDEGTSLAGVVYLLWAPGARRDVRRVVFTRSWDAPGTERLENAAPYDVMGTGGTTPYGAASPLDLTALTGEQRVTAVIRLEPSGTLGDTLEVSFGVAP